MVDDLRAIEGVRDVYDLRVWSISKNLRMLSAHIVTDNISISSGASIQQDLNKILAHEYNIQHATLQLEYEGCHGNVLFCNISEYQHEHAKI